MVYDCYIYFFIKFFILVYKFLENNYIYLSNRFFVNIVENSGWVIFFFR